MTLVIAKEYSKTPGGRFKKEGAYSGEEFRTSKLLPAYIKAKTKGEKLVIDLDGGYGYGSSFLEEAFGGLARELRDKDILDRITIKSDEEPILAEDIRNYMEKELGRLTK